jgi:hypothetical protein
VANLALVVIAGKLVEGRGKGLLSRRDVNKRTSEVRLKRSG